MLNWKIPNLSRSRLSIIIVVSVLIVVLGCKLKQKANISGILPGDSTLQSMTINPNSVTILVGQSQQYIATGVYPDGTTQNLTSLVTWTSDSLGIATIDSTGLTQGLSVGTATITATYSGISANTNITINTNYTIGGTVAGLAGTGLVLTLNSSENLNISANGNFLFTTQLSTTSNYTVTVTTQPSGEFCSLTNSTGTVANSNISNVTVSCTSGNTVGPVTGGSIFNPLNLTYSVTTVASGATYTGVNGVTTDGLNIYFTIETNHTIVKLEISTGTITNLAGTSGVSGTTDGIGTIAKFSNPSNLVYVNNNLYITDYASGRVRKLNLSTNVVNTIQTGLSSPYGITSDGTNLYVTENGKVQKILISTSAMTTLAGNATQGYSDGIGSAARFMSNGSLPGGITFDGTDLYLSDRGNCAIRKVVIATGTVTTIAGSPPPTAVCSGPTDGIGTASVIRDPDGIISDGTNLFFAESTGSVIRKIDMSTFSVTTVAGLANTNGLVDGTGSAARFRYPASMTSDGTTLYIADWGNNAIRKMQ